MKLKELLIGIAPTVATALFGPVGGLAVQELGKAFGIENPTVEKLEEAVKNGSLTGEQIVAAKAAELAFTVRCKELDIDLEKIHAGDRDSARKLQQATGSKVPATLALIVVVGFFGLLGGMMGGYLKPQDNQALLLLLGSLAAAFGAVVQFYFGSSASSQSKDAMLAKR
jgi:hypothetical protein